MEELNEIQQEVDKRKYIESEKSGFDLSGQMSYCRYCPFKTGQSCLIEHKYRVENNFCAKAYNCEVNNYEKQRQANNKRNNRGKNNNKK